MADGDGPDSDLAVIHCKGLTAAPLRFIKADYARPGTEVTVLGFPGMKSTATPSLKVTRGSIAGLPDEACNCYMLDALTNPGNSGGPIFDATGSVLGIHRGRISPETDQPHLSYGVAVPHSHALPLLKKWIPSYTQLPPNSETKEWPAVDDLVSHSTVLILIQDTKWNVGVSRSTKNTETAQPFEDRWCMTCYGRGTVKCRDCQNGTVATTRIEQVFVPALGRSIPNKRTVRVPCKTCKGMGLVSCPDCDGGIEPGLGHGSHNASRKKSVGRKK